MMTGAPLRPQGNINRKEKLNAIALNLLGSQLTIHLKTSCFVGKNYNSNNENHLLRVVSQVHDPSTQKADRG